MVADCSGFNYSCHNMTPGLDVQHQKLKIGQVFFGKTALPIPGIIIIDP